MPSSCVIVGGGPAGMMCGYLLARAGVDVTVLEKHKDFLRDFRGDTIHPSTLQIIYELGLLDDFLKLPHQEIRYAEGEIGDRTFRIADLTHLPTHCKFLGLMPQRDFLDFMAEKAKAFPDFHLMMETEATALLRDGDQFTGVRIKAKEGERDLPARLVIAADGRHSVLRGQTGLKVRDLGAPMDVLWFRIAWREGDAQAVLGRVSQGRILVMLYRGDYWQCAYLIRKGSFDAVKQAGLEAFRAEVARLAKRDRVDDIENWDDVKLLTVTVDRLEEWALPGLLLIGDAAHAMSPIGGVGINLAIQDAVATANLLNEILLTRTPTLAELRRIRARRLFVTRIIQAMQVTIQNNVIGKVIASGSTPKPPLLLRILQAFPLLQRLPARLIGLGVRPEHVESPARAKTS